MSAPVVTSLPVARQEAARRTRLGYPHRVVPVRAHDPVCLVSDGLICSPHPCTCGRGEIVGYTVAMGRSSGTRRERSHKRARK